MMLIMIISWIISLATSSVLKIVDVGVACFVIIFSTKLFFSVFALLSSQQWVVQAFCAHGACWPC